MLILFVKLTIIHIQIKSIKDMNKLLVKKILELKTSLHNFCDCQNPNIDDYNEATDVLASYTLELTELVQVLEKRVRELENKLAEK